MTKYLKLQWNRFSSSQRQELPHYCYFTSVNFVASAQDSNILLLNTSLCTSCDGNKKYGCLQLLSPKLMTMYSPIAPSALTRCELVHRNINVFISSEGKTVLIWFEACKRMMQKFSKMLIKKGRRFLVGRRSKINSCPWLSGFLYIEDDSDKRV